MHQRRIGSQQVGAIGLGCMSFAGFYGPTEEAESHACLSAAVAHGMTHLDTALIYGMGRSEEIVGRWLAQSKAKVHLATKGGIVTQPTRGFDNSPERLRDMLEGSLRRLGVDHVDLYYIHRREPERPIEDVMETLVRFKEEGKIGGIGFSEIAPSSLRRAHTVHPVTAVQSEYSLWTRQPELGMLQACAELGVSFVAFSPIARGMLSQTAPVPAEFGPQDFRTSNPRFTEPSFSANLAHFDRLREFSSCRGWTLPALGMAWLLQRGPHVIPIPGTRSATHLAELAAGARITLTPEDMTEIERIMPLGFAHGARYSDAQQVGVERYC